jgi:hypothetical protein
MGAYSLSINHTPLELSEFGQIWGKSMWGPQSWKGTVSGMYVLSTVAGSTGQYTLQLAAFNQTKIQDIRFYTETTAAASGNSTQPLFWAPAYSSGMSNYSTDAGAYIGNVAMSMAANALATVSFEVAGFGPINLVKSSSGPSVVWASS